MRLRNNLGEVEITFIGKSGEIDKKLMNRFIQFSYDFSKPNKSVFDKIGLIYKYFDIFIGYFKHIIIYKKTSTSSGLFSQLFTYLSDYYVPRNAKETPQKVKVKIGNLEMMFKYNVDLFPYAVRSISDNQYNLTEKTIKGKIFVDAGANMGLVSIFAAKLGAEKVYAFEPVSHTYNILLENIKLNKMEDKVIPIKKALGNENKITEIFYDLNNLRESTILPSLANGDMKKERIVVVKLDDVIKGRVDFIKIDVEGFEANVLRGAKNIIRKWKPILAFSAYHKKEDIEELPKIVKSIRPDYKIELHEQFEKDFYCT